MIGWLRRQAERFGWRGKGPEAQAARSVYSDGVPPGVVPGTDHPTRLPDPLVPPAGDYRPGRIDPTREYVGSSRSPYYGQHLRVLERHIDDLTRDFGDDLYERMLLDDMVAASTWGVVHQIISEEIHFRPAVEKKRDEGYEVARAVCEFAERDFADLQVRSIDMWAEEVLFTALACGNKVSEKVYEPIEAGQDAGRLGLCRLTTKPRRNIGFVVNQFSHVVGIRAVMPGVQPFALPSATVLDPALLQNVLPRHKFAIMTWRPKDGDPRGSSLLHPAYQPWWDKQQMAREWLKALAQFGSPVIYGTPPEGAQASPPVDELGNIVAGADPIDPVQALFSAIQRFRAGGAAAFPAGTQLHTLAAGGGIEVMARAMEGFDKRITRAIRLTTRDTMESEHGSRADSQTAQDVVGNLIRAGRRYLLWMLAWDVVYPSVLANWGPEVARRYCPKPVIGSVEHHDFAGSASAVSSLWNGGVITPSQLAWLQTEKLGLPAPEDGELDALVAQKQGGMGGGMGGLAGMLGGGGAPPGGTAPPPAPEGGGGDLASALPNLFGDEATAGAGPASPPGGGDLAGALPNLFGG